MSGIKVDDLDQTKAGWYFTLIGLARKPPPYAWLDPSKMYLWKESFSALVEDLVSPFLADVDNIDLVAGIDGMGFILGAAIAQRLGKGFLAVRKAGHLCVDTLSETFYDYQKREKKIEIRTDFPQGSRVLLVDQWVETGGTSRAAANLIERLGGSVAGITTPCMETSEGTKVLQAKYRCFHATPPEIQAEIDRHDVNFIPHCLELFGKK